MGLETNFDFIENLNAAFPEQSDVLTQADNHMRGIKNATKGSFPNLGLEAVTATAAELNNAASTVDGKVDIAGDEMTGNLSIKGATTSQLVLIGHTVDNKSPLIYFQDEAGNNRATLSTDMDNGNVLLSRSGVGNVTETVFSLSPDGNVNTNGLTPTSPSNLTRKDYVDNAAPNTIADTTAVRLSRPGGGNADTLISTGFYTLAATDFGMPIPALQGTANMTVINDGTRITQLIVEASGATTGGLMYMRSSVDIGATWGQWLQLGAMVLNGTTLNITL